MSKQLVQAERTYLLAQTDGGSFLPALEKASALSWQTADLLVLAYQRCHEAHRVNRAIRIALRGETWTPYNAMATTD